MKTCCDSRITVPLMAIASTLTLSAFTQTANSRKPFNVIFIASDDMNSDLNAFGNPAVHTPNFDRLAQRGIIFNHAYNQAPLSAPSRASLMTGYLPDKTGVYDLAVNFREALPGAVTLAQMFKNNGYYTCRIGKIFHQNVPSGIGQPGPDDPESWTMTFNPIGKDRTDEYRLVMDAPVLGTYLAMDCNDDELTDAISANVALSILRQRTGHGGNNAYGGGPGRPNNQSFFLAVGFYRPHIPYMAPKKYFDMYPLENIKLPERRADDWDNKPDAAAEILPLNGGATEEQQKKAIQAYYACITFVDAQIGKLLDGLEEFGLLDNTIIVFWSDHGYNLGEHGQWQKQTLFEKTSRQPLLISVPGYSKGTSTKAIVQMVDIYPTLAEITGLDAPDDLAGHSLVPLLKDPEADWHYPAFTLQARTLNPNAREGQSKYLFNPNVRSKNLTIYGRSVRVERYRYTEWDEGRKGTELYDYENDPNEFKNLVNEPDYKELVKKLAETLHSSYRAN
jgi:iduronate 2-sulfatase